MRFIRASTGNGAMMILIAGWVVVKALMAAKTTSNLVALIR